MAVTIDDVRRIAALARLGLTPERTIGLVAELNTILGHMDVLSKIDTSGVGEAAGVGRQGQPLRSDGGMPIPLARPLADFAPAVRDGLLLVPRLATHESVEEA